VFFFHSRSPIGVDKGATEGLREREAAWKVFGTAGIRKPLFARVVMACWFATGGTAVAPLGSGAAGAGAVGAGEAGGDCS
jgi:hypothetical protein